MMIYRTIEIGVSAFADFFYLMSAASCFMSVVFLGFAAYSFFDKDERTGVKLLAVGLCTGLMSYPFHAAYSKMMIIANGASSQPFYEMVLFIAVGSMGLLPIIAIFNVPSRKIR